MQQVKYVGQHEFHKDTPVFEVPSGTLAARDAVMSEHHGFNHATGRVLAAGAWNEVYEELARRYEELEGRPPYSLKSLFYIVREGERTSCGCVSRFNGFLYFSG